MRPIILSAWLPLPQPRMTWIIIASIITTAAVALSCGFGLGYQAGKLDVLEAEDTNDE